MGRAIATAAVWLAPALAVWVTKEPDVAWSFLLSVWGMSFIWSGPEK